VPNQPEEPKHMSQRDPVGGSGGGEAPLTFVVAHIIGNKRVLVPPGQSWLDPEADIRQCFDEDLALGDTVLADESGGGNAQRRRPTV
jgi:hypothetical protein